jgi:hypothetical protein
MQSKAKTVAEYLKSLPEDRRHAIATLRNAILANLDKDYEESMQGGMIGYSVPHRVFPDGYHCDPTQPLPYMGLASQKQHISVYLMAVVDGGPLDKWFRSAWMKTGKKLDMGKCCVRFRKIEDAAVEVIAEAVKRSPAKAYIAQYQSALAEHRASRATAKPRKPATKKKITKKPK